MVSAEWNYETLELSGFSGPVVDAAVSAGYGQYHHVCAVVSHGDSNAVECLGYNNYGQLGDGTKANQDTPQPVNGLPPSFNATQVAASYSSACASNETHAWCWGYNQYGQLGDGTTTSQDSGANDPVIGSGTFDAPIADLQCGGHHCCMLLASGNMSCWGYNNYGQLGDGMTTSQNKPVVVAGLDGAIALMSVGYQSSCAVTFDNELYCWVRRSALGARVTSEFDPRHPVDACACPSRTSLRSRVCVASLRSWFVSDSLSVSCLLLRATHTGIQRTVPAGRRDEDESVQTNTSHHCAWPVRNHEHLCRVLSQLRHRGRRCRHVLGFATSESSHGSLMRLHSMASFIFPPSPVCGFSMHSYGQFGDGTTTESCEEAVLMNGFEGSPLPSPAPTPLPTPSPSTVAVLSSVDKVFAGDRITFLLNSYGSLWAVGRANDGQLGDGANAVARSSRRSSASTTSSRTSSSSPRASATSRTRASSPSPRPAPRTTGPRPRSSAAGAGAATDDVAELTGFSAPVARAAVGREQRVRPTSARCSRAARSSASATTITPCSETGPRPARPRRLR